jgi:hypothetical protein
MKCTHAHVHNTQMYTYPYVMTEPSPEILLTLLILLTHR